MLLFLRWNRIIKKCFKYSFTGIFLLWYIENKKNGSKKKEAEKKR